MLALELRQVLTKHRFIMHNSNILGFFPQNWENKYFSLEYDTHVRGMFDL